MGKAKQTEQNKHFGVFQVWLQVHIYSKSTHTFVQMAGGQARGGVRKRITVLRMEALNEACPVPTIKQKLSVRPASYSYCKSTSTPVVSLLLCSLFSGIDYVLNILQTYSLCFQMIVMMIKYSELREDHCHKLC